jgi:L-asparaginase
MQTFFLKSFSPFQFLIIFLLSVFQNNTVYAKQNDPLPTVVIITTGGTIAEKLDPTTGAVVPAVTGDDLIRAVPGLNKLANIRVINFLNIDSSQMKPENWYALSQIVDKTLKDPDVAGVIVTHGTDSMAEGAYFLDLTIKTSKPVVFVGSMRSASDLSPDGPANIYNAVTQVTSPNAKNWGVTVSLNQYINSARTAEKTQTTNVQTFESGEKGYLGYIANGQVMRFNERLRQHHIPLPNKLANVALLSTFAGDDGRFVRYAVDSGADAVVIEGVGAGNVNAATFSAIQYALSKKRIVVVTSQVHHGAVEPIYGGQGGGLTLQKAGVILGGDLSARKARILLMLALPQFAHDTKKLQGFFY